ncbi:MAG: hypothetical protein Q4G11_00570 [Gallicola sp.]|nr:hypothetical protein [Gallicola sp.]
MEKNNYFEGIYIPEIIKIGKLTSLLGVLVSFGPALVLAAFYGIIPPWGAVGQAFINIAGAVGVIWIIEPISYFPILGVPGNYLAFITGNISNLRVPSATAAQNATGFTPGTHEGTIVATIGMAVSVVVNIVILAAGVFAGNAILSLLPENVVAALNFLLPALFGALFVQFALVKLKLAPIALAISIILTILSQRGITPSFLTTLIAVFGTMAIGIAMEKGKIK